MAVRAYRNAVAEAERQVLARGEAVAGSIHHILESAGRGLTDLADDPGPQLLEPATCGTLLPSIARAMSSLSNIIVVDSAGRLVCSSVPPPDGDAVTVEDRRWFELARERDGAVTGLPTTGRITGEWVVGVGSAIRSEDGAFLGVVAGSLPLLNLQEVVQGGRARPNELVTVTTDQNLVVARSQDPESWIGRRLPEGDLEIRSVEGTRFITRSSDASGLARIWSRIDLPTPRWRVYVGVPEDRVLGAQLAGLRRHLLVALLVLALAAGAAAILFRSVSKPLAALTEALGSASHGKTVEFPTDAPEEIRGVVRELNRALHAQERAEEGEREARARYEAMFRSASLGMLISTADGELLDVNPALVSMLGYDNATDLRAGGAEDIYASPEARTELLAEYERLGQVEEREVEWVTKDGELLTVRISGRRFELPDGRTAYEMFAQDVTEHRALERLTRHQQKMEAVGRLAGGVAHEFNNLLTVMGVNAELLREGLAGNSALANEIQEMEEALRRAGGLTSQLLAFSRRDIVQPRDLDVSEVVADLEGMLRKVMGELVTLETDLDEDIGLVRMDPGQLEQVLLNLVINARDAMPTGGSIRITTRSRVGIPPGEEDRPRWYVVLSVTDDGPGIDEGMRDLVFEPFFTTKPAGKGTGLGLPTVYAIVSEAGGTIRVRSRKGQGATFDVWLPVRGAEAPSDGPVGDAGRAVVAIQNEGLRALVVEVLTEAGFDAAGAGDGPGALDAFWGSTRPPELLVTAPEGPRVEGTHVVLRIRQELPSLPVLWIAPSSDDVPEEAEPADSVLGTPFSDLRLRSAAFAMLQATGA